MTESKALWQQQLAADLALQRDELDAAVGPSPQREEFDAAWASMRPPLRSVPSALDHAHAVFRRWLGEDYDTDALDLVMAAAAVERLDGDPLWMLLISGSGNAKTETVSALTGAGGHVISTITSEGALLSGSPKRERTRNSHGGLLRKVGDRGVVVIKDLTSILSMNRDLRSSVLAALREIYDGYWSRNIGSDGGQTLEWRGRLAVIGAVTTAWDEHYGVIASMGDRFVLVRMDSDTHAMEFGRQAMANTGDELEMRGQLAGAVGALLADVKASRVPARLHPDHTERLLRAADVVTRARTGVIRDQRGEVMNAHAREAPTRFAKQLTQVVRGALALGLDLDHAMRLAIRCARDSVPPLRLAIIDDIADHPGDTAGQVRQRLNKPKTTVRREMEALQMLAILDTAETEVFVGGREATRVYFTLAANLDPDALKALP